MILQTVELVFVNEVFESQMLFCDDLVALSSSCIFMLASPFGALFKNPKESLASKSLAHNFEGAKRARLLRGCACTKSPNSRISCSTRQAAAVLYATLQTQNSTLWIIPPFSR